MDDDLPGAVICTATPDVTALVLREVERAGFEVRGVSDRADDALQLVRMVDPSLVVIEHELPFSSGLAALPELHEALGRGEILFITWDPAMRDDAVAAGAFGVVYKNRLEELPGALGRLCSWLDGAGDRPPDERRSGSDRRQRQDWSKVTSERRAGEDRRGPTEPRGD